MNDSICKFCKNELISIVSSYYKYWYICVKCNLQLTYNFPGSEGIAYFMYSIINNRRYGLFFNELNIDVDLWVMLNCLPVDFPHNFGYENADKRLFTFNKNVSSITPQNINKKISTILTFL